MAALAAAGRLACEQLRCHPAAAAGSNRPRVFVPFRPASTPLLSAAPPAVAAAQQRRRGARGARLACRAAAAAVDVETARKLLDGAAVVVDVRSEAECEGGRITKPPRKSINVPFGAGQDAAAFAGQVASKLTNRNAKLIVMCRDGGADSAQAAQALAAAGYAEVLQMEGGFAGYSAIWSPSGKRRPPSGRWVSTGKEALKSGLNIPGVAESYDEGGNLKQARWAQGLQPGQELPPSSW